MEKAQQPQKDPIGKIINVNLNDGEGFQLEKHSIPLARLLSGVKVIVKVLFLSVCVFLCCILFWFEAVTIAKSIPIYTLEEIKQVEDEEAMVHLKAFILILWAFAVYTLITEMMTIMSLNEKIRILESIRHRSKMESTLSLIRQKSYFDADAVDFIIRNQQNDKIETVNDEMEAETMVHHRVHGMNPRNYFY